MTVKALLAAKRSEVSGDVVCIAPSATIDAASKLMAERRIGSLVILGADRYIAGIISERDIVRVLAERGGAALDDTVGNVMTRDVITCIESDTISKVMGQMTKGKFRHVPVVDNGRLTGIVSIGDVVKRRLEEVENESQALRDYIRTA